MGKIIAFANQKGGVGKTTTAVNLSASLAYRTRGRVLLVDSDPQGNATSGLGINKREVKHSVYDVVLGNCGAKDAVIRTKYKNLDIIPSSIDLAAAEIELVDMEKEVARLGKERDKILAEISRGEKMLSNPGFVNKAPAHLLQKEKEKLVANKELLDKINSQIADLK